MCQVKAQVKAFESDEECSDPIQEEHHAIFDCSAYTDAQAIL